VEIQALCDKVNQLIISEGIEIENGRTSSLVTPRNIRYYCTIGIMPPPKRLDSKSTYDDSHVEAVLSIKRSQMAGLSLKEISAQQQSTRISPVFSTAFETQLSMVSALSSRNSLSLSESISPNLFANLQTPNLGWSLIVGDCHLSGFGVPPRRDQLDEIEKILGDSSRTNDDE
jgi:DNA-binding transcriptional MerR regulator